MGAHHHRIIYYVITPTKHAFDVWELRYWIFFVPLKGFTGNCQAFHCAVCLQVYCHFKSPMTTLEELDMVDADFTVDIIALIVIFLVLRVSAFVFLRWKLLSTRWGKCGRLPGVNINFSKNCCLVACDAAWSRWHLNLLFTCVGRTVILASSFFAWYFTFTMGCNI